MKINKETIAKIAHLSRLELNEEATEKMVGNLSEILDWVEKLNEIDTDNVEPLFTMSSEVNMLREDKVGEHLDHESGLKQAPKRDSDYFRVPKVME
jgi:aspartyl-tRNA(Asn)/glutamyl-tRNA(Gln) amidotransferase subunit C